jgi:hypothetical protein
MTDRSWTLTVNYINGVVSITGENGEPVDKTIYRTETDTITFQAGTGVRSVASLTITSPCPLPAGITVTQLNRGTSLVVTDFDNLASDAAEVDVVYCVNIVDSNGNPVASDPKLINMPILRPT